MSDDNDTAKPRTSTRIAITRAAVLRALRYGWPSSHTASATDEPSVAVEIAVERDVSSAPRHTRRE